MRHDAGQSVGIPLLSLASPAVVRLSTAEGFCVATYGARLYLLAYPPLRLRLPTPTRENHACRGPRSLALGWANFATRLRRWVIRLFAFCRSDDSTFVRDESCSRLTRVCSGAVPSPAPLRLPERRWPTASGRKLFWASNGVRGIRDGVLRGREWIAVIARDRKSKTLLPQIA